MKRSEIDTWIEEALQFFPSQGFSLPSWSSWTVSDWREAGPEADEIRAHGLGWNLTDFGNGDFFRSGLMLFILRNGLFKGGRPEANTKNYCEKAMMVRPGQITPWHFHKVKTEDLINRGGGRLEVELGWPDSQQRKISQEPVIVQVDGLTKKLNPGAKLILEPGESVTLPPLLCHQFCGHPGDRNVCVGEVSSLNDDLTDNYFLRDLKPRQIIEDKPAMYHLIGEYPPARY